MRRIFAFLSIIILLAVSNLIASDIQFPLQISFTVPGLSGQITQIKFNDINGDGFPEVLATDGNRAVLYSITEDSILYSVDSDSGCQFVATMFKDVTRDSIPDLVLGSQMNDNIYHVILGFRIDLFDGANNYALFTKTMSLGDINALYFDGFGSLSAIDLNSDGYNELMFSCSGIVEGWYLGLWYYSYTVGRMFSYSHFPDSMLWQNNAYATDIDQFETAPGSNAVWITTSYSSFREMSGTDFNTMGSSVGSLSSGGQIKNVIATAAGGCWGGEVANNHNWNIFGCASDLNTANTGIEAISVFYHYDACPPEQGSNEFYRLQMHSIISPDSVELIWSRDTSSLRLSNFLYDPSLPGYFMAFSDSILNLFRGSDGSVKATAIAPPGATHWDYPFANDEPKLITLQDCLVSIYRLDITVDYNESENQPAIPSAFTLGQNYPNPFNPETRIEFSLPEASNVTIEVLNLLGQKVKALVNERMTAGRHMTTWNGKNESGETSSSGVYFYRITTDGYNATKKMMLLK